MKLFRAVQALAWGRRTVARGTVFRGDRLRPEAIVRLLAAGAIAEVSCPPLAVVPGWSRRAARLEPLGLGTVEAVLDANPAALGEVFRVRSPTAERWQRQLEEYMSVPAGPSRG